MNMKESKTSNMLGGKTARACDSCLVKRARWFCSADDAFLCQSCDGAVHSANQLASRHERVRLESSSCKASPQPAWLQGLTKKARTPRKAKPSRPSNHHHLPLVPEIGSDDPFPEENDENLFCRVPIFDEFTDDFFTEGVGSMVFDDDQEACGELNLEELAEFAADVESLLGAAPAGACGGDLEDYRDEINRFPDKKRAKIEEIEDDEVEIACFHFTPNSSTIVEFGEETKKVDLIETAANIEIENESQLENRKLLRLDHEAVIAAWASQGSPWTDGIRPNFNLDEFMASCSEGRSEGMGGRKWAGREARVLRYREKRRTRLFSKKIRYEVRKLNAEKRPRMKGRFVKRTAFLGSSLPYQFMNNK